MGLNIWITFQSSHRDQTYAYTPGAVEAKMLALQPNSDPLVPRALNLSTTVMATADEICAGDAGEGGRWGCACDWARV